MWYQCGDEISGTLQSRWWQPSQWCNRERGTNQASGGEGIGEENLASALPLKRAAFAGFAWNRPLGRENDQLGVSAPYGQPTDYQRRQGFGSQYGIETYWKFNFGSFFRVMPSIQLLRNKEDNIEMVIGVRAKLSDDFARHFKPH